ncbi:MAG: ATP phosphoribosyltransferase regulatory subunit [Oscillospiraceae bacterium]|nr:ATP phosphoribosyltransferase regulatory subunit [Oscillospiraceae bacterium]
MKKNDLITPEGTRDLLFGESSAVKMVESRSMEIFRSKGYSQVITPGLEFYDVFALKSRYFPQETMYKLVDGKGRLMVVRPDSTLPIARMTAARLRGEVLPLRLCYSQTVYRSRPGMRGRRDEIRQTGIELIGSSSERADLEMLANAVDVLSAVKDTGYRLELGHIGFFKALLSAAGCDEDASEQIRSLIEYKNYPALGDLLDEYDDSPAVRALRQLPRLFGGEKVFEKAYSLSHGIPDAREALHELESIYTKIRDLSPAVTVDLGLVNHMNYYTGIVVKGYIEESGDAVLSGGRYDGLLAEFGCDAPATGFAVNIDALARAVDDSAPAVSDVIVYGEDGCEIRAIEHARQLVAEGTHAELSVFDTIEDTLAYAKEKHISRIVRVGRDTTEEVSS